VNKGKIRKFDADLKEVGITLFLTSVVFLMMIGYPALLNYSPSTQQAFALQEPTALDYYNFNPILYSSYLVAPVATFPNIDPFYDLVQQYQERLVEEVLPHAYAGAPPMADVNNFARTLDNINQEIDLSWDSVPTATDYIVQRLSTEDQVLISNSLEGDNNFATTCIACGDFTGVAEGDIITMSGNKVARLGGGAPTNGIFYSGIWLNIVVGGSGIDQIVPEMRGELESTGIMASAGSRLSRDCNSNSGGLAPVENFRVFSMKQRQDGYTQWHDGTYTDGACIPYARYLGNQLFNLTSAQVADSEITAIASSLNGSGGLRILKEGVATGQRLSSATTGLWSVGDEIESGTWELNKTWQNITTTSSTSFTDLLVGNWNSYWYRIIPKNISGDGNPSNILNATLSKPPLRVADLNGTDNGSGTVDLVWTEAEILFNRIGISEDPVQGYLIQRNIVVNETTVYDGLSHDVEEFFLKNDGFVTLATDQASGTGSSPSFSSDKSHGGQMLNITSAVNITRLVIKVGTSGDPPIDFNTEPDLGGAIFFKNGTLVARTIIPRVAMTADIGSWSVDPLNHENFVNWVFSPPVPLEPDEYAFVWSGLGTQNCNSAGCGSGNADVGDYEFFFENTNNGDADGYAIGDIQQNGVAGFGFVANSVPLNNSKTNDYAMAVYAEDTNWVTIGTNVGVSNTSFSDTSAPLPPLHKSYRILAFNDAGISDVPTYLQNPQGTLLGKLTNSTDFFPKDEFGRRSLGGADDNSPTSGLNIGEMISFGVTVPVTAPTTPTGLTLTHDNIDMEIDLDWNDVAGADDYTVQRLSTERTITTTDNVQGDNNFASGSSFNRPVGDSAGLAEGDIGVEVSLKMARFSTTPKAELIGGLWYNVTLGDADGKRKPDSTSEVEFAGFMVSSGSRLSRDCNGNNGFTSLVEQDGYTQRSDGTWFDGACLVENRFLGNQLINGTGQNLEIGAMWLNGTISVVLIKEGIGSGFFFDEPFDPPTGKWESLSGNIELRVKKLNQTFVDVATTLTSDFIDTTTNNFNSYFYRIIANNAGGSSQASDIVNGTLSVRPQRVPDLNGTDNGSTVDLVWQEAPIKFSRALSEDPVQGYLIQRALSNETTIYDGLAFDTEEFFWKSVDSIVTLETNQASGTGGSPSFGSNVANGGQIINITQSVNITRMVVKIGVSDGRGFNAEPDLAGGIWYGNGTAITRSIFPRVANDGDMSTWATDKLDHEGFINWAFSPPVPLLAGEYIFGWSSLNTQVCNSASCGLGNADVGDYEVFFEFTNNGDADGYGVVGHGGIFPPTASSQPINNTKTTDYAMAIFAEPVWETIGTNIGVSNTSFTDNSPPIGVTKSYRVLAFNDAGISHPPTLLHNPQDLFIRQMSNNTDFFFVDVNNEVMGLNVGELLTFTVFTPPVPSAITDLVASVVGEQCNLSWTVPSGSITGHRILRAVDGGNFVELIANSGTSGSHSDLGLVIGSLYQYDVHALNAEGEALSSNIVSCTPVASGVAPAPTGLTASNLPNGDVQLMWDNPNNPSISGYQIERKLENGAFIIIDPDTGNSGVTFTDTTTVLGNEYTYRISSINTFGFSDTSNEATIMTLMPPNTPTLSAEQVGTLITLTWTEPTSDGTVNGYKIEKRTNFGSFSVLVANTTNTLLTFDDSAVTKPNTYGYRVSAHDDIPSTSTVSNVVDVVFGSHLTVFVKEQDNSGFKGGGFVTVFNSTVGGGGGGGSGITGFTNSGSLGSAGQAVYTEAGIASTFVTTTGIINQGVIKNGTSSLDTDGEIIIGNSLSTWNFLHRGNVGDNVTSINFWLKGDVVGAPVYPIIGTGGTDNGGSDAGWALWTQSGNNMIVSVQESSTNNIEFTTIGTPPPDDSNWHMITYVQDKGNTTGNWIVYCLDGSCANVGSISAYDGLNPTNALFNMTIGGGTPFGNDVVQNTFDFDDLTIWQGYQLTQSDVTTMYNSGTGSTGGNIQSGSQVVHISFDAGTEIGGGGGGGGGGAVDFTQTLALDSTSKVIFDNLDAGTYNYTFIDNDNFVLNKTFNNVFPAGTSSDSFSIFALVFDVDCPNTSGTDVRIKLNYTDLQSISSYPATPVCDNSDKISWATTWTGDTGTQQSQFIADFISPRFRANADNFLVGLIPVTTSYSQNLNRIISSTFDITTASDVTINFDVFLGDAPAGGGDGMGSGGSSGSGSTSIPSQKIVFTNRLQGLTLLSISHMFIQPSDVIKGTITVGWQGEQDMVIRKISVDEFTDIIRFAERAPFDLDPVVVGAGETARSEAEIQYTIFIPDVFCDAELGITLNCFPPELVVIPVEFTFEFEGQDFIGSTEIVLDARPIPIPFAQLQTIALFIGILFSALVANSIRKGISKKGKKQKKIRKRLKG